MPKVPLARIGQVQTRALPGARFKTGAPVEAFGGGREKVTQAATSLVAKVGDAVEKEQDKANRSASRIRANQFTSEVNDLSREFSSHKGISANENKEAFNKRFKELRDKRSKDIPTARQEEQWAIDSSRTELNFNKRTGDHAFSEHQSYVRSELKSDIGNIAEDIASNYNEKDFNLELKLAESKQAVEELAAHDGVSEEAKKAMHLEASSLTHKNLINEMLNRGEDKGAKEHFKKYKKEISQTDRNSLDGALEEGILRGESQRATDKIMSMNLSREDALAYAREKYGDELEERTVRDVKTRYAEQKQARDLADNERFEKHYNEVDKTRDLKSITADEWVKLSASDKVKIRALVAGKKYTTNFEKYDELSKMAYDEKEKFKKISLTRNYRQHLSDSDLRKYIDLQSDMRSGKGSATFKVDGIGSDMQQFKRSIEGKNFTNEQESLLFAEVTRRVEAYKYHEEQSHIESSELQKIIDHLIVEGTTPGSGFLGMFKDTKMKFEFEPGVKNKRVIDISTLSPIERRKIDEYLVYKKIPRNDKERLKAYQDLLILKEKRRKPRGAAESAGKSMTRKGSE
jgi:hypothetical protein